MQSVNIELHTVTAVFLHGVHPDGAPELRPPSFRGVLRYWFRVAASAVIGDNNVTELQRMESEVFGDSSQRASLISINIAQTDPTPVRRPILPHGKGSGFRPAIMEGQSINSRLFSPKPISSEIWNCALSTVELATIFGGIGQRSRRGYGSLRISSSYPNLIRVSPVNHSSWAHHLQIVVQDALSRFTTLAGGISPVGLRSTAANYPAATTLNNIWIGTEIYPDPQSAVRDQMEKIHNFIGLPGNFPSWYLGFSPLKKGAPRQASPLWVRVIQTRENPVGYSLLFSVLASSFTGQDYCKINNLISTFPVTPPATTPATAVNITGWNA